jgi:hypothetical protein
MANIEQLITYSQPEWWRKYFTVDVGEFYINLQRFLKFQEWLSFKVNSEHTVDKLLGLPHGESFKRALLGGFRETEFVENALGRFYKDVYGIYVEKPALITARQKEGLTFESSIRGVECKVSESALLSICRAILSTLKSVYTQLAGVIEEPKLSEDLQKRDVEEFSKNAEHGIELLKNCLQSGIALLPAYNPATFFLTSLLSTPRFYVQRAYSRLNDSLDILKEFGIHVVELLRPDIPDEAIREERAIIGHAKGSIGDLMCAIVRNIYALCQQEVVQKYFNVRNEFEEYVKQCLIKLRESVVLEQFKDIISKLKQVSPMRTDWGHKLTGAIFFGYEDAVIEGLNIRIGSHIFNYSEFVAYLAPQTFLGVAYMLPKTEGSKQFSWMCILGGW